MPCTASSSAVLTTSATERLCPRWITSAPEACRMRRMMLIAASWPSKSAAAVTKRTLFVARYGASFLRTERSVICAPGLAKPAARGERRHPLGYARRQSAAMPAADADRVKSAIMPAVAHRRATVARGFVTGLLSAVPGRDRAALLRTAGIDPAQLSVRAARVPLEDYAALYNVVVRGLDDEGFGLFARPIPR